MKERCVHHNGTRCSLGLYGGKPSFGICALVCDKWKGPPRPTQDMVLERAGRIRWLKMWWHGQPWPKRIRLKRSFPFVYIKQLHSCGCNVAAKSAYNRIVGFFSGAIRWRQPERG